MPHARGGILQPRQGHVGRRAHRPINIEHVFLWEILGLLRVGVVGDEVIPGHGGDRDWVRELAEMEWSSHESICI